MQTSPEGFELTFATNHMGHYYFTRLVSERLLQNAKTHQHRARVIVVSSGTHDPANHTPTPTPAYNLEQWKLPRRYNPGRSYAQSKLANALFANDLATQFKPEECTVATFDPGFLPETSLLRNLGSGLHAVVGVVATLWMYIVHYAYGSTLQIASMDRTAPFLARLAVDSELLEETGRYYCIDALDKCSEVAATREYQVELREFSEALLKEKGFKY